MNVLILGYGLEGKSVENFFKSDSMLFEHTKIDVLSDFKKEELLFKDFSSYDLIFRSPSLPPKFINAPAEKITSATKYFFHACPCPIIGVTGTKGKGTTCTMIKNILDELPPASCPLQLSTSGEVGSFAEDPELRRGRARDTRDGGMSRRASAKRQRPQRAPHYIIVCPHYEGYDERILSLVDFKISLGNFVLTGGELPALVLVDSIVRLLPGVLGGETSAEIESFSDGNNLEYPQYTKPADFRGMKVPDVLLSGHHENIQKWRNDHSGSVA